MTIRKRGNVWEYRFDAAKVGGKRKQITKSGFKTKKACEDAAIKAQNYYKNGGLLVSYADLSYADLLSLWFETMRPTWKPNTAELYKKIIELKLTPALGSFKVKSLTPLKIQDFINQIYKENSLNYARLVRIVLGASLKYAVVPLGIIPSSPAEYIKIPKKDKPTEPSCVDLETIQKAFNEIKAPYNVALMIALHTGLRLGEVFALNWGDIDLNNKIIDVNKTLSYTSKSWLISSPKTNESRRRVPFGDSLARLLSSYRAEQLKNKIEYGQFYVKNFIKDGLVNFESGTETDFLLTERWGAFAKPSSMERYCRKYGFRFHALRHTHATSLMDAGINPKIVKERLGHSNVSITLQTYTHPTEDAQRAAVSVFEKRLTI